MTLSSSLDCPIYSLMIAACGSMPVNVAYGLLEIANGHFFARHPADHHKAVTQPHRMRDRAALGRRIGEDGRVPMALYRP